ncbi:uncharacterized protein B0I36DRAFT_95499 [Microdochium trichocladiopsis]|uniref:Uncharacterized protein n=1 Tax=Microdochium trichocladiopsis TaxID=1682393 RepID=A0A9P8YD11_9PEZI|nr:uncharacterized protein B0I36DRAFT_95499 [Microdochium trichocladiopsis]KAH7035675.1 hypothetical protein B0I36DRAFT_95499 [Microdochium trichocladiopsis]
MTAAVCSTCTSSKSSASRFGHAVAPASWHPLPIACQARVKGRCFLHTTTYMHIHTYATRQTLEAHGSGMVWSRPPACLAAPCPDLHPPSLASDDARQIYPPSMARASGRKDGYLATRADCHDHPPGGQNGGHDDNHRVTGPAPGHSSVSASGRSLLCLIFALEGKSSTHGGHPLPVPPPSP